MYVTPHGHRPVPVSEVEEIGARVAVRPFDVCATVRHLSRFSGLEADARVVRVPAGEHYSAAIAFGAELTTALTKHTHERALRVCDVRFTALHSGDALQP